MLRPCLDCGVPTRGTRCGVHQALWDEARNYGGEWPAIRLRQLIDEPFCRICGAPATEVDHIHPLRDGGTHERSNLQSLCGRCHRRKTRAALG